MATPSELQQQVYDLLSKASNLSFVSADTATTEGAPPLSLTPGQRVTAEVLAQAQGNRVPVRIGNQQVNLEIPIQVRPGQNLELTFVANDPRPTFAMSRPGVTAPPVTLSDASRLLSLLLPNEQVLDPRLRTTLQNIGELLRRSSGEVSVLANFLDDVLTYRPDGNGAVIAPGALFEQPEQQVGEGTGEQPGNTGSYAGKSTTAFEDTASKLLLNLARQSKFTLVEVANQPLQSLPLQPGDEANAVVQGTLPGGRVFVQLAGESLELQISRPVQQGEILRLTLVSQQPKTVFALMGMPVPEQATGVSDAARWLSALVKPDDGQAEAQKAVLSRLQQIVSSLPPGSPALAAIMDEVVTYTAMPWLNPKSIQGESAQPAKTDSATPDEDVLKLLQGLMKGNRLAIVEPQLPAGRELQMQPGEQVKGEVLQSLPNGRFSVQVAGQNMEMILPKGITPGEPLNLFFVGNDPQSFLLVRHGKGGDAVVSQTGRWVSTLLSLQNQSAPLTEGLGILRTVLQETPSDPALLGESLAKGLRESGLFYESHLARWFSGEYPLESILNEPQGKLSLQQGRQQQPSVQQPQSDQSSSLPVTNNPAASRAVSTDRLDESMAPKGLELEPQRLKPGTVVPQDDLISLRLAKQQDASEVPADSRTLPIVKEQLATLQTGHILFHGELFPGQPMEWRIEEREGQKKNDSQKEGRSEQPWETSVSITLPGLGKVDAALKISGNAVDATVKAVDSETAGFLDGGRDELAEQLAAAGLEPGKIEVRYGGRQAQE